MRGSFFISIKIDCMIQFKCNTGCYGQHNPGESMGEGGGIITSSTKLGFVENNKGGERNSPIIESQICY